MPRRPLLLLLVASLLSPSLASEPERDARGYAVATPAKAPAKAADHVSAKLARKKAINFAKQGDFDAAQRWFERGIGHAPDDFKLWYNLAVTLWRKAGSMEEVALADAAASTSSTSSGDGDEATEASAASAASAASTAPAAPVAALAAQAVSALAVAFDEALGCFERAGAIKPQHPQTKSARRDIQAKIDMLRDHEWGVPSLAAQSGSNTATAQDGAQGGARGNVCAADDASCRADEGRGEASRRTRAEGRKEGRKEGRSPLAMRAQSVLTAEEVKEVLATERDAWARPSEKKLSNSTRKFGEEGQAGSGGHSVTYLHRMAGKRGRPAFAAILKKLRGVVLRLAEEAGWGLEGLMNLRPRCVESIRYQSGNQSPRGGKGGQGGHGGKAKRVGDSTEGASGGASMGVSEDDSWGVPRNDDDSLGWHADLGSILTMSMMISEPEEYEGGVVEVRRAGSRQKYGMNPGDIVVWRSWEFHRVQVRL